MLLRLIVPAFALVSLFIFPWPVSLVGILAASFLLPPAGIALGILMDLLYYLPGTAFFPYFTLYGAFATGLALLVRRFVKTRIIEG